MLWLVREPLGKTGGFFIYNIKLSNLLNRITCIILIKNIHLELFSKFNKYCNLIFISNLMTKKVEKNIIKFIDFLTKVTVRISTFNEEGILIGRSSGFLYQPEKPRRNPSLGIAALRIVKQQHPDTKIYVYGSNAPIYLDFEVENLGLIGDLSELNALYNKCQIGLCISMSNPSRIPFEFMAAGTVPVDVYRYNNLMDYPTGTIKMAYQSSESLAEAICQLLENKTELNQRSKACQKFAKTRTLEWETDVIVNSFLALTEGKLYCDSNVKTRYTDNPVMANCDIKESVITFCKWQKNISNS